jgi:hypothetical protein
LATNDFASTQGCPFILAAPRATERAEVNGVEHYEQ